MGDSNNISVPAPVLWGALAVVLGGGSTTAFINKPWQEEVIEPAAQVLTVAAAQSQHDQIIDRIIDVEIGLLCFGKGNAKRAVRYWEGLGLLNPDQAAMLEEQVEFLAYYKRELAARSAMPCIN